MAEGIFRKEQLGVIAGGAAAALIGMGLASNRAPNEAPSTVQTAKLKTTIEVLAPSTGALPPAWLSGNGREIHLTLVKRERDDVVRVYHTLTDRYGLARAALTIVPPQFKLTKDHITAQTLRIEGDGDLEASYSGRLLLIASQESASPPLALPIVPARAPSYSDHLLLIGAALGLASVLFGSVAALIRFGAGTCMRDVAWASNSWASNAGVISAALASMIAFVAASDARLHLSNSEYTFLVAAFGAPLVLAPVLFNALRRACPDGTVRGVNGGYILASGATMLGTQLELTLLAATLVDLNRTALLGPLLLETVRSLVYLVIAVFVCYGNYNVYTTIRQESGPILAPGATRITAAPQEFWRRRNPPCCSS